jgi:hypothetical protein
MRVKPFRIVKTELVNLNTGDIKKLSQYGAGDSDTDLVSLTIKESMFSPSLEGEAVIRDYSTTIEELNISIGNYDTLRVTLEQVGENEYGMSESKILVVDLSIYAFSQETSEAEIQIGKVNIARLISLKLASKEHYLLNYNFFDFMDDDKVMKISYAPSEEEQQRSGGASGDNKGMVQYLIDRMGALTTSQGGSAGVKSLPLIADNTANWVWLKKSHNFYPWGKFIKPPRLSQMMQLLAENAVDGTNNNAVNFFFWQNLENWNFRSVESIITEYKTQKKEEIKTYYISPVMNRGDSIRSLESGSDDEIHVSSYEETDFFDLLRSYAFGSLYTFVEPKYGEDPYARYLDVQGGHIYQDIYYDYFEDGTRWQKIEGEPKVYAQMGSEPNKFIQNVGQNLIADTKYGYFSPNFFNKEKKVAWEYKGYEYSNRDEEELWQTQFDITDMRGEELKIIQEKIKKPLKKKKEEYAKKKNLKEKWKVYKCSICCAGDVDSKGVVIEGASGASGAVSGFSGFSDPRFEKSFNLRNDGALSNYEIVAAGSFTDTINFDAAKVGVGFTGFGYSADGTTLTDEQGNPIVQTFQNEWTRSGMTLSYNLNESPYNLSMGEFFNLEQNPDNFVTYRFDLEIKRHEKLKQILETNIATRNIRKQKYQSALAGYTAAYVDRNDTCLTAGCTGYCLCPTEYPETVKAKVDFVVGAHDALSGHEEQIIAQIDPMIEKLKALKAEFLSLYSTYWSRKAFFFSRDIDFSFLKSGNNLFNIKSITRRKIATSKYAPFAVRKSIGGTSGYPLKINEPYGGCGGTEWYPYDIQRDVNSTSEDSVPITSPYAPGIDVTKLGDTGAYPYYDRYYSRTIKKSDFWESFESPFANFPYSEAQNEKAKGPIWYRNWLVNYEITLIKPPCLNRKPPCFEGDCSCDEIVLPMRMHFETFANGETADILTMSAKIKDYAFTQLSKNCDGCRIRITSAFPSSDVKLYHPWAADELGKTFSYVDYKKSSSFFNDVLDFRGTTGYPPHMLLEGEESYIRVEFKTPIGQETLKDFPEGFNDTYGSEYFLPYIVLATAGPFGSQSARTNISVIGQDPYGFDLAVKKIKNRDDFAGMNLMYTDGERLFAFRDSDGDTIYPDEGAPFNFIEPFSTSSSWLKTSQNSLFYKPKDGIADLFVPNGIQDVFMASRLERSLPAKTWWDLWVSLPPIAVATFYNRWDVLGTSGGSLVPNVESGITYQGVAFYDNNSIVAEPVTWTGDGCSGGCSEDPPWPLFLQPDTEQIITGAFPSNVAATIAEDILESSASLGDFDTVLIPGMSGASGMSGNPALILPRDPSNYVYRFAEFPHIVGIGPTQGTGGEELLGITSAVQGKNYPVISYPIGTLIWGKFLPGGSAGVTMSFDLETYGFSGEKNYKDYNVVHRWDMSRKTQYGLVSLSSDSMPSLLSLIGGVGGQIEEIQEYQRWVSNKLIDWFQNTIFDNNFAGQFVVLSKQGGSCKGYPCMNPEGFPGIEGCPPNDPLCNCPCQGASGNKGKLMSTYLIGSTAMPADAVLRPDLMDIVPDRFFGGVTFAPTGSYGPEPSSLELEILEKELSECELIKKNLGEQWLGCVWDKPDSPYNCSCPNIGRKFPDYMKYNRTYSTFWGTPLAAPLLRTAQMALLNSNKISITVPGDLDIKAGQIINVESRNVQNKRFRGKWLVTTINRFFNRAYHMMTLTLSREGGVGEQRRN